MWPRYVLLAIACSASASLSGCGGTRSVTGEVATAAAPVRTSNTYVFAPGQSVAITPGATLKLERVNDSRCQTGAVCVWAGYISYSFTLTDANGSSSFVLSDSMPGAASSVRKAGLTYSLQSVEPATPPPLQAAPPSYRVTIKVAI